MRLTVLSHNKIGKQKQIFIDCCFCIYCKYEYGVTLEHLEKTWQ